MTSRPLQPVAFPFSGGVEVAQLNVAENRSLNSAIEIRTSFINNTHEPIVVGWRSGLKATLPPKYDLRKSGLIVRVEFQFSHEVKNDVQRILSGVGDDASAELKALRDAFTYQVERNRWQGAVVTLDYPITIEKLKEHGGSVYYEELDVVVSLEAFENVPPHPATRDGRNVYLVSGDTEEIENSGFLYSVDIVDNLQVFGERFMNINNKVYKVKPKKDLKRRDGLYITSNRHSVNAQSETNVETIYYPLEKAEECGLYKSMDEAMALGDIATVRKQQLAEVEHQLSMERKKLQQLEQQHKLEVAEKDRELKRIEGELKEKDLQIQRSKDFYDERAWARKDQSEGLRMLPAIAVGLGAIFAMFKAVMS